MVANTVTFLFNGLIWGNTNLCAKILISARGTVVNRSKSYWSQQSDFFFGGRGEGGTKTWCLENIETVFSNNIVSNKKQKALLNLASFCGLQHFV